MHVLHLIDDRTDRCNDPDRRAPRAVDAVTLAACRLLVEGSRHRQTVCLVGGSDLERRAERAGLSTGDRVVAPMGLTELAWRGLRRLVNDRGTPDLAHCWSSSASRLATLAFGRSVRRIEACPCDGARTQTPPIDAPSQDLGAREAARSRLGLEDSDTVVLLAGSAPHADALRFVFLIGTLGVAGRDVVAVLPGSAAQLARGLRYYRFVGWRYRLIVSDEPTERVLPAADLAVWVGGGQSPTTSDRADPDAAAYPIALAHGAGVPLVAPEWAGRPSMYTDPGAAACLGHNATLPELARKLIGLIEHPDLRRRLGAELRRHVAGQRFAERFVRATEERWERSAPATSDPGARGLV